MTKIYWRRKKLTDDADRLLRSATAYEKPAAGTHGFLVTSDWVQKNKTLAGGWKAKQLALIGVNWPPRHGWIGSLYGRQITFAAKAEFESYAPPPRQEVPARSIQQSKVKITMSSSNCLSCCGCSVLAWEHCEHTDQIEQSAMQEMLTCI